MRRWALMVLGACGALLTLCAVGAAAANASNAVAAHACQQGGWKELATSAGERFSHEGACVSYAAQAVAHAKVRTDVRCTDGGHLDLFRQDGTSFSSESACHRYAARDALVHLEVTQSGEFPTVKGRFVLTSEAGYGLLPGSGVLKCGIPPQNADWCWSPRTVAADGTHAAVSGMYWDDELGGHHPELGTFFCWNPYIIPYAHVTGIYLVATTAEGMPVRSRTIVPTGCG